VERDYVELSDGCDGRPDGAARAVEAVRLHMIRGRLLMILVADADPLIGDGQTSDAIAGHTC
jgi:hypothetical protein